MTFTMPTGGWDVLVEVVGALVKWGISTFGEPTAEIKKKLMETTTLPDPGEADAAVAEAQKNLPDPPK